MQNYQAPATGTFNSQKTAKPGSASAPRQGQQPRAPRVNSQPQGVKYERIKPMQPQPQPQYERSRRSAPKPASRSSRTELDKKLKTKLALRDYFFGLAVGFIIFGIAAIIVCNALISMVY